MKVENQYLVVGEYIYDKVTLRDLQLNKLLSILSDRKVHSLCINTNRIGSINYGGIIRIWNLNEKLLKEVLYTVYYTYGMVSCPLVFLQFPNWITGYYHSYETISPGNVSLTIRYKLSHTSISLCAGNSATTNQPTITENYNIKTTTNNINV